MEHELKIIQTLYCVLIINEIKFVMDNNVYCLYILCT